MRNITGICMVLFALAWPAIAAEPEARVLTLEEALWRALETDERIQIQREQIGIAGLEINRAWTIISPRFEARGSYERPETAIQFEGRDVTPEETWRGTFTATQPIFDGRVLSARRAGMALEGAEEYTLVQTIRASLFEVVRAYYETLRAQEQVRISELTRELASREVDRARARFEAGEVRRTEVLRAEVDESVARRNLITARNSLQLALSDLARRVDLPTDEPLSVDQPDAVPEPETAELHPLYLRALEDRDDLAAARSQAEAAREERTVIRRDGWPTVSVQYNHRFIDPESFANRNNFWDVAAVARLEFWDGGSRRISRVQQERRIDQASLRVQELEKRIEIEVRQALLDLELLRENVETIEKEVRLAEENYRTLSEQARVGLATGLDVSTALNALDRARTELTQQQFDLEVAKYNLQLVIGRFADPMIYGEE